jgi:hypothetical protein
MGNAGTSKQVGAGFCGGSFRQKITADAKHITAPRDVGDSSTLEFEASTVLVINYGDERSLTVVCVAGD